jgi:hypothetical protein
MEIELAGWVIAILVSQFSFHKPMTQQCFINFWLG